MIKGVVFDLGGVLAYDVQEYLFADKMFIDEEQGLPARYAFDPAAVQEVARRLWRKYAYHVRYNAQRDPDAWRNLEKRYWREFTQALNPSLSPRVRRTFIQECIDLTEKYIKPVDGMPQFVETLHGRGLDLIILSNNTEFWFHRQSELLHLERYVQPESIILSCRRRASKTHPRPTLFEKAFETAVRRSEKAHYLYIDDRFDNIAQANRFGLAGILFPSASPRGCVYLSQALELCGVSLSTR